MFFGIILLILLNFVFSQKYEVTSKEITNNGIKGTLNLSSGTKSAWPEVVTKLNFQFFFETEDRIRLKITDPNERRWEVPFIVLTKAPEKSPPNLNYDVYINDNPFFFRITRKSDGHVIFTTEGSDFFYSNQYLEIATKLEYEGMHAPNIFGLGERISNFRLSTKGEKYVIFNKDHGTPVMENLYGTHPYYMQLLQSGKAHGVFILNSNAQEFELNSQEGFLKYRTIGGILDMFFFIGDTPKKVTEQYLTVIGKPVIPPYWAMGYHHCRWGYKSISETWDIVNKFHENNIPLETIWNDIDYMNEKRVFTVDPQNFKVEEYKKFIDFLHSNDQHYMAIIDPGVKNETNYSVYENGKKINGYIKKSDGVTDLVNAVWPGFTVFPDWSNPAVHDWWKKEITDWLSLVPWSGMWIDMNEIGCFCDGECLSPPKIPKRKHRPKKKYFFTNSHKHDNSGNFDPMNPPYVPGGANLNEHTISMNAVHKFGIEYNVHNLYGFMEAAVTYDALTTQYPNKLPFIISRSTFAGSGRYTGHWLGDNSANFNDLFFSISGCLSMSIFGISTCGADICGFGGSTSNELCIRWYQLGAFYPFMRNHNDFDSKPQEPFNLGQDVVAAAKKMIGIRYSILPYYYTEMVLANVESSLAFRPIFFEFPSDPSGLLPYIDRQFLIGPALMISPVVFDGHRTVDIYVPNAKWYDFYNGKELDCDVESMCTLQAPLDHINIHVRGGYIVPNKRSEMTTVATRRNPFGLLVALDENGYAKGYVYVDDGEMIGNYENKKYSDVEFEVMRKEYYEGNSMGVMSCKVKNKNYDETNMNLDNVFVMGVNGNISIVKIDDVIHNDFKYDSNAKTLVISNINTSLLKKDIEIKFY